MLNGFNKAAMNRQSIDQMAAHASVTRAADTGVAQAFSGNSYSAFAQMTGIDYRQSPILKTNPVSMSHGSNAQQNAVNSTALQGGQLENAQMIAQAETLLDQTQQVLMEALEQSVDADDSLSGMTLRSAQNSFVPAPEKTMVDAGAAAVASKAAPAMTAINDAIGEAGGRLTAEQEAIIADRMRALLTPARDIMGNVVEPAKIPNDLKIDPDMDGVALAKMIKEVMRPPEQQEDFKPLYDQRQAFEDAIGTHVANADLNDMALANAEKHGLDAESFDVETLSLADDAFVVSSFLNDEYMILPTNETFDPSVELPAVMKTSGATTDLSREDELRRAAVAANFNTGMA